MMNRQQLSWLVIRAFGLYLLLEAFMHLPDLLGGLYAARYYSNLISSLSSGSDHPASTFRPGMYVYFFAPLLKIVLFSAAGIYLLRDGAWLVRLLDCYPDTVEKGGGEGEA
jgi:hypothetical protein